MSRLQLVFTLIVLAPSLALGQSLRDARTFATPTNVAAKPASAALTPPVETYPVSDELEQWITELVLEQVPREYASNKKWGGKKKVMSGLDWELDGVKVETRRQWKEVNHGNWSRYRVKLIEPEKQFRIEIENLRNNDDGAAEFDLIVAAKLDCYGQVAHWQRGVQLVSMSVEADANARMIAHVVVKMSLVGNTFPPDILLQPKVTSADLKLDDLKLRRVSQADGPVVKSMSGLAEEGVEEIMQEQRDKLVDKMNAQIVKKKDKLRIPLSKVTTSKWGKWFGEFFAVKK